MVEALFYYIFGNNNLHFHHEFIIIIPFLKKESVILDLTRIALDDNELTSDPCLFTFEPGLCRSEIEDDFPSQLLADKKLPSRLPKPGVIIVISELSAVL